MLQEVVKNGINKILSQEYKELPALEIKIGIDYGANTIVQYGSDEKKSLVDLLGASMNMAAKVQGLAQPNQIVVGKDVFDRLHPNVQELFSNITTSLKDWTYTSKDSDVIYPVYAYKETDL